MAGGGKAARNKGANFERKFARLWQKIDPTAVRNVTESQRAGFDIVTDCAVGFQLKCWSKWRQSMHAVLEQAESAIKDIEIPVAVVKVDYMYPVVAMYYDDYVDFNCVAIRHGSHLYTLKECERVYDSAKDFVLAKQHRIASIELSGKRKLAVMHIDWFMGLAEAVYLGGEC